MSEVRHCVIPIGVTHLTHVGSAAAGRVKAAPFALSFDGRPLGTRAVVAFSVHPTRHSS